MTRQALLLLTSLGILFAAAELRAQTGYHVDSRFGFKFRLPVKWKHWPVEKDRRVVTGHYVSIKTYPMAKSRFTHRPVLRVITLPNSASSDPQTDQGIYGGYRDYLLRNLSGKLKFEKTGTGERGGFPYTSYRIRRSTESREYELTTWVYKVGEVSVAVEFMVLQEHSGKLRPRITTCLRSFRSAPVAKTGRDDDPWRPPLWQREPQRWRAMPFRDRVQQRAKYEERFVSRVKASLTPGFNLRETEHFLVLSSASAKFTAEVIKAAESCRKWCEEHLDGVSDEVVIKAVIRVFDDSGDYQMYRARSRQRSRYVPEVREILAVPGRRVMREMTGPGDLNEGVLHYYLADKDVELCRNLPNWVRSGLVKYLDLTRLARGKLVFEGSDFEKRVVREGAGKGSLEPVWRIIAQLTKTRDEGDRRLRYERAHVVRFVLHKRSPFSKAFLADYLIAVREVQKKHGVGPRHQGAGYVPGVSAEAAKKAGVVRDIKRKRLLEAVNRAVCNWKQDRWEAIEKAYARYNKKP